MSSLETHVQHLIRFCPTPRKFDLLKIGLMALRLIRSIKRPVKWRNENDVTWSGLPEAQW